MFREFMLNMQDKLHVQLNLNTITRGTEASSAIRNRKICFHSFAPN